MCVKNNIKSKKVDVVLLRIENLPKLLDQTPYRSSTNANDKLRSKNKNKFLEFLSLKINRFHDCNFSLIRKLSPLGSLCVNGSIF